MTRKTWPVGLLATGVVAVLVGGLIIGVVMRSGSSGNSVRLSGDSANKNGVKAAQSVIVCPDVAGELPAIPASARAEVTRNLVLLQTQIDEANKRLVSTVGQGGPKFVDNAILGPLEDKRVATIDRIAIAIGRTAAKPTGLDSLAACGLSSGSAASTAASAPAKATPPASKKPAAAKTTAKATASTRAGSKIVCPAVAGELPAIPASAQAEVTRNLALLQTQIDEADKRLVSTVGQGGPKFVDNAILGPLKDKRVATIDRIAIAIGRTAAKPTGLDSLATCKLT